MNLTPNPSSQVNPIYYYHDLESGLPSDMGSGIEGPWQSQNGAALYQEALSEVASCLF